jgi:hypothetical protein
MDGPRMGVLDLKEFSFNEIKSKNYDLGCYIIFIYFFLRDFNFLDYLLQSLIEKI